MNATPHCLRDHQHRLRVVWSVLLAVGLLASALTPSAPVQAEAPRDVARRIEIVVKSITIIDDHDFANDPNGGELSFRVLLVRDVAPACPPFLPFEQCNGPTLLDHTISLRGSDGDIVTVNQTMPDPASFVDQPDPQVRHLPGIPLFSDESYTLRIVGRERDLIRYEDLGTVTLPLKPTYDVLLGNYHPRASKDGGQTLDGDFIVDLEIRDVPLPDLRPVGLKVVDVPGSASKTVCVDVANSGGADAAWFDVAFEVDDETLGQAQTPADRLPAGAHVEVCASIAPTAGPHEVRAVVDAKRVIDEVSDTNNLMAIPYTAPAQSPSPAPAPSPRPMPSPTPGATLPDLTVTAIEVNGRVPDGKDDCKDGKNTVTVTVKNAGTADAGSFDLRLTEEQIAVALGDKLVDGLKAGQQREVRFDGMRLKKGTQTLEALAGAKEHVSEINEGNNALKVTARCQDDD